MALELSPLSNDDIYLLTGLAQGDAMVFRLIYQSYERKVYNIAFFYTGSEEDAEDIVQDVFTSLWLRREKIELKGPLENYITRCAKYTAFFYLKMRQKKKHATENAAAPRALDGPEEHIRYKDMQAYLHRLLESLSHKTREIFFLSRYNGLSYPEIANKMDISVKTVEYHVSLALRKIASGKF
ncbi:RNA polymerase sigma-70 factor, ECF subfamily [Chitinophaga eiseniae]|uniref:RNA polymerase sigma-70 factor, ECF subfamily n=1 Tax=Chitinophaga eiseniae TaxID=634771 RepID=A0A1T4NWR9_9BACT|nr:RNA polymerase sigma-70 factor [Chitinophaga eiseniae]SJZ83790.1 RNA polymerase sigma-70 factor, ECF subfamily [Chitinophaga eiseniae]